MTASVADYIFSHHLYRWFFAEVKVLFVQVESWGTRWLQLPEFYILRSCLLLGRWCDSCALTHIYWVQFGLSASLNSRAALTYCCPTRYLSTAADRCVAVGERFTLNHWLWPFKPKCRIFHAQKVLARDCSIVWLQNLKLFAAWATVYYILLNFPFFK